MPTIDQRVDAYIKKAKPFAQPGGLSSAGQFGKIASLDDLPSDKELTRILEIAKKAQTIKGADQ